METLKEWRIKINAFIARNAKKVAAIVGGLALTLGHVSEYVNNIVQAISALTK